MKTFIKFMFVLLSFIIMPIINGFVFLKLWQWFIVSTFQLQSLRLVEAIGITFLLQFIILKSNKVKAKKNTWKNFLNSFMYSVILASITLFFSWIVSLFI